MPYATHSETVVASVQTIWKLLLDTIESPADYLPEVEHSEILVRGEGFVIRRKTVAGLVLTERITADQDSRKVVFALVDHPSYRGTLENLVTTKLEGGYPTLTFTLDWQPREGARDDADLQAEIVRAVKHAKKLAEKAQDG
jgi:hypothetical protein